nr:immunoglobulin light chain junction region [Macaca mulatta]
CQQYSSAPFTI